MALQVKFYRGPQASYFTEVAADGIPCTDSRLSGRLFKKAYESGIFYATDTKNVFIDGIMYGFDADDTLGLKGAFVAVNYTPQSGDTPPKLVFTNFDGTEDEVTLSKVTTSTNAVSVTYDSSAHKYDLDFHISATDQVLTEEEDGLKVNIHMDYDSTTHTITLTGKTKNSVVQDLGTIVATDFVKDGMIKNVSIVNEDDHGNAGRYLKIEWNDDSDDHDASVLEHGLTTYVNLADFFDVIVSDSSAITVEDYHLNFVVASSQYIEVDNGQNGQGLVFHDASIDNQFTDIKNVEINGHAIGDSISDSSLLIVSTEIPVGALTDRNTISDTSILGTDSVEMAIAKLNRALMNASADSSTDLGRVKTAVGLNADGTLPLMDPSSFWLKNDDDSEPANLLTAVGNLDKHVHSIDVSIESMDYTETSGNGDFTQAVSQTNGQISASRGWIAEQSLHGYTGPSDGSYGLSSSDTINSAFAKVDKAITWNIVS